MSYENIHSIEMEIGYLTVAVDNANRSVECANQNGAGYKQLQYLARVASKELSYTVRELKRLKGEVTR